MYIGIDIGGTHTRIAGSPSLKNIELTGEIIIPTAKAFEDGIFEIIKNIKKITNNPEGVGIGLPGSISEDAKDFDSSVNLKAWVNKPIIKKLNHEFSCPVYIENDAVAQAYGEALHGFRAYGNFIYLVWGTGVGGALVSFDKDNVSVTKLGRPYLDKWEKKYGGKHLEAKYSKSAKQINDNEWDEVLIDFKDSLFKLSEKLNVNTIVVGGGVVSKQRIKIVKIAKSFSKLKVFISELNDSIGVYGAIALIEVKSKN
jgi:predicted NBD/HSP70 family sugar kinase